MLTRTLILGFLAEGQMHGYEISRRIREKFGESAAINFGSIYYGLKRYLAKGWVDLVGEEQGKGSPERTVYRITPKGRRELKKLVETLLEKDSEDLRPVEVGLAFMDRLGKKRYVEILSEKYERLRERYEKALEKEPPAGETPVSRYLEESRLYRLGAEVRWLKNLLPRLRKD